ncbi:DUF4153 domain-containing protein [Butyrivibrio sp. CB08]|uniref:DUF4153 domain-containing protein n=1 Tax=Butyrivibrio sp. CB08 TaxID=2364879 RepID=UPI000EA8E49F|nr:DUF4153 domain-containing protein [Butyrivibrio sp. CB08]RKM62352.1 DUF4153 domain-containing protein [Butyrivibrio sp. CB08]
MLWVQKLKSAAKGVLKEHLISVCVCFVACLLAGISEDIKSGKVIEFLYFFLFLMLPCLVTIEACYQYRIKRGSDQYKLNVKTSLPYLVYFCISLFICFTFEYLTIFKHEESVNKSGSLYTTHVYLTRFLFVYIVISVIGAIYFFYKNSDRSLEQYSVRAFLGVVKAGFLYGVVALGSLCLIYAFQALLFDFETFWIIEMLIMAVFLFPGILIGLSKITDGMAKFAKVLMGYVLPVIVALACAIVYIYIVKIIVLRSMPSNEAFAIMTGIFASGLFIWTFAQGCTEDPVHKYLLYFPVVFAPFIVVQIISLSMRVAQYGLTKSRYLGVLLIVFELIYVGYYVLCLLKKKGVSGFLFLMLIAPFVIYFLVPGINMYSAVTASQAKVVSAYLKEHASGAEGSISINSARSAMYQIKNDGSLEGMKYIEQLKGKYSQDMIISLNTGSNFDSIKEDQTSISVYNSDPVVDVSAYKFFKVAEVSIYNKSVDPGKVPVYQDYDKTKSLGYVDLEETITELKKLSQDNAGSDKKREVIDKVIPMENGAGLYIYDLDAQVLDNGELDSISYSAYYLYNN